MHTDPGNISPARANPCVNSGSQSRGSVTQGTQTEHTIVGQPSFVKLNVGGVLFTTSIPTLCSEPGNLLAAMVRGELGNFLRVERDADDAILVDLDPTYFRPVLNYLRHGTLIIPSDVDEGGVLAVAEYLGVRSLVRLMKPERPAVRRLLFSWGSGSFGELGTQRFDNNTPSLVRVVPFGSSVVDVALGADYTCVLTSKGDIYTFGGCDWGQLGLGSASYVEQHPYKEVSVVRVPQRIPLFERCPAVHVAAGFAFAMAVTADHRVYFWGNNNHGQSGLGREYFRPSSRKVEGPTLVPLLDGKEIVQLSCGSFFTLGLGRDGTLYSWGLLDCLGLGTEAEVRSSIADPSIVSRSLSSEERVVVLEPQVVRVPTEHKLVRVHAGQWHSGAISSTGELFTWGIGFQGRLGHGNTEPVLRPKRVRGALADRHVVDVACGSFHTVALTDCGSVYCWGDNTSGQCGMRWTTDTITSPNRVVNLEFIAGGVARSITCDRQRTIVVMEGPQSFCRRPCCRLGPDGKPRASHGQVFVFGESSGAEEGGGVRAEGGMMDNHFRRLSALEGMNVTCAKSGLTHTFAFAEELDDSLVTVADGGRGDLGGAGRRWSRSACDAAAIR
uniref:BTB domain-containing protein n=1 Tax=Trypanosoma congolense (strain IL3000) TaxID=1068625 RepID=G0UQP8_TRYCI|nr:conserved hypothetical protein [Trypanosoma congolense IL3000]